MVEKYKEIVKQLSSGPLNGIPPYFIYQFCMCIGNFSNNDNTMEPSYRHEGNGITFHCYRSEYIEEIHAANDELNPETLKRIISDMTSKVNQWLLLRKKLTREPMGTGLYRKFVQAINNAWISHWTLSESYYETFDAQDFAGQDIDMSLFNLISKHSTESRDVFILQLLSRLKNKLELNPTRLLHPSDEGHFFTHFSFGSSEIVRLVMAGKAELDDRNMKRLNIEISSKMEELFKLKDGLANAKKKSLYNQIVNCYCGTYTVGWRQFSDYYAKYSTDVDEMFDTLEREIAATFDFKGDSK